MLYPLLLNVQSDLIHETGTRVVVPMVPAQGDQAPSISSLAPVMDVNGTPHVLVVPLLAATEIADLGAHEADFSEQRSVILAALDLLISGI
ncbi:MAG: CcdB family protein [Luteimonas sp.]|nr:CcdB family protein [Luteimonas sp.]